MYDTTSGAVDRLAAIVRDKRVLVTGGAGAIGAGLTRVLSESNDVTVLDDLSSGSRENLPLRIQFANDTIIDDAALDRVFANPFDLVFHLAANFANQNSVDHPERDLLVNGLGTLKVLERAHRSACARFVYASSSCVYGDCSGVGVSEQAVTAPETPYGMTKLLGEEYALFFHRHHGLPVTILRYFNCYGPGERPGPYRNVIPNMFARALDGLPLCIFGSGDETRDFTYVLDIVQATLRAAVEPAAVGEVFNVGRGQETRIRVLAESINELTGNVAGLEMAPRRNWDHVTRRCADIAKARKILGYDPVVALQEGLRATHRWLLAIRAGGDAPSQRSVHAAGFRASGSAGETGDSRIAASIAGSSAPRR